VHACAEEPTASTGRAVADGAGNARTLSSVTHRKRARRRPVAARRDVMVARAMN
jgi:hypothetical protein